VYVHDATPCDRASLIPRSSRQDQAMSGPAIALPALPRSVRAAAAAEIALELGRPWLARDLVARALSEDPACERALAVGYRVRSSGSSRSASSAVVGALRAVAVPEASRAETAAVLAAILEHGHARVRPSRRHRGEPLRAGSRLIVHHALADVAIVVRGRRPIGVRLRGRPIGRGGSAR